MEPVPQELAAAEARWPMVGAIVAAMVLTVLLPDDIRLGPRWVLPAIEGLLLAAVLAVDPRSVTRRSREVRVLSIGLVSVLVIGALWSTVLLIDDLIHGGTEVNSAGDLLEAGTAVWVSNNIAFALLYWELDGGGAAERTLGAPTYPDLAFPQQLNPRIGPPGWQPRFLDYLYLSFTNATAFSPTEVMPLVPWAKTAMAVQAAVSLGILGLVIARAVNIFS